MAHKYLKTSPLAQIPTKRSFMVFTVFFVILLMEPLCETKLKRVNLINKLSKIKSKIKMAAKGCTQKKSRSNKQNVLHWWLSWKLGQSLWLLEQTFYWSQQGFCRCFIVDGLLFQALALKIFDLPEKFVKHKLQHQKNKYILAKAVLANLETGRDPAKPPKKTVCVATGTPK